MTGVAALAICAAFTSCSKSDELYDQGAIDKQKELSVNEKYVAAFEKAFGKVGSNVDWGFVSMNKTRAANTDGNIWYKTYERPYNVNLTSTELAELKALLTKTGETYNTQIFPHENYYVEQIYKGGTSVANGQAAESDIAYDNNGKATTTSVTGSNQMDWLHARNGNELVHINNFNFGNNTSSIVDEGNGTRYTGITLMENMSLEGITATNQFAFTDSWGTNKGFYYNYLIVQYKGEWYVGFDYEGHKGTDTHNNNEAMQVNRNWAFTDWIVRISPAVAITKPNLRVIAEDLSASDDSDFDFNDVVFDVIGYDGATNTTTLRLQACGGTLPLKVGSLGGNGGVEVHSLYGDNAPDATPGKYKMWNTGKNSHAAVDFTVAGKFTTPEELLNLRIEVCKDNVWMPLTAQRGVAACKILVDDRFPIVPERHSIANAQGNFTTYVAGEWNSSSEKFWWVQE